MLSFVIECPSSVCPSLLVHIGYGASLSKRRPCQAAWVGRTRRRDCDDVLEDPTPDHWSSSSSCSRTPQAGTRYPWMEHWERHYPWSNQWNPPFDITNTDPRQCGDGRCEVIPTFDGENFRQYQRRVRLFASTSGVHSSRVKEYITWKHRMVLRICSTT